MSLEDVKEHLTLLREKDRRGLPGGRDFELSLGEGPGLRRRTLGSWKRVLKLTGQQQ